MVNRTIAGWVWVAGQVVVLVGLVLLPGSDHWPTPGWVEAAAGALFLAGLAIVAVVAFVFFDRKAAWEERQLEARYPGYPAYAATTPKFVPRPWRSR